MCLAITTTVILINSPVDAISTLLRSMDGTYRRSIASRRVASRRVASRREEGSPLHTAVGATVLSAYYRHYTRTNNFVQTRHPLAKPLNTVVKRVTRLKIQGNVYTCLVKFVLHADKSLEGTYCRPLPPIQHKSFKRAKKKIYIYIYV